MYIFIVNPYAGNGKGKRVFTKILKSKLYKQVKSSYFLTQYSGHAEDITRSIIKQKKNIKMLIVIGGDGTLHEVVNGLDNKEIPLSFIPSGSGNDFARGNGIENNPIEAFNNIINNNGNIPYWVGHYKSETENKQRLFVNSIGFGFDAQIAMRANKSRLKRLFNYIGLGRIIYIIALIQVLIYFKPMTVELETDGSKHTFQKCWMVTIANQPYYGGGMKIIPTAIIQPTILSLLVINSISKWKILGLFMTVFTGKHTGFKEVEIWDASTIKIKSQIEMHYHVDGEASTCNTCVISKESKSIQIAGIRKSILN